MCSFNVGGGGWGNGEKQVYTDSPNNAFVKDGKLNVRLLKSRSGEWTSARMTTYGKFSFALGKVEVRLRLQDPVDGPFPAVWMLGDSIHQGTSWPTCGELDIFEFQSRWNYLPASMHYGARHGGNAVSFRGADSSAAGEWRLYSMIWEEDNISFFQDGVKVGTQERPASPTQNNWPYTSSNPFYLLINNAMQPSWGTPPSSTLTENTLEVDYIRVYQKAEENTQSRMRTRSTI